MILTEGFRPGKNKPMDAIAPDSHSAFLDGRRLATGALADVAAAVWRAQRTRPDATALVFRDADGHAVDLDLRGDEADVATRHAAPAPTTPPPRGRGRPRLGVVAREVTLLPEHWAWLATQPGGASVALRRLVHAARRGSGERDGARVARERAYRAMVALAGDRAGFEDASRALFAGDAAALGERTADWPADVRGYVLRLSEPGA
jgi:hypothetical protein